MDTAPNTLPAPLQETNDLPASMCNDARQPINITLQQFFDRCEDFGIIVSNLGPSVAQLAESKQSELDNIRAVFEQGRKFGTLIYADEERFNLRAFASFLKYVGYQREPAIRIAMNLRTDPHPEVSIVFEQESSRDKVYLSAHL